VWARVEVVEEFPANRLGLFDLATCNDHNARVRVSVNVKEVVALLEAKWFALNRSRESGELDWVEELLAEFAKLFWS